jgi:rfaE bifunctional protein kinase chain/domain/rfaE bifunctional protein nucleotidyltransferase chain/domain
MQSHNGNGVVNKCAKIRHLEELSAHLAGIQADAKTIVHCHGVFDPLHIGHIRHFEQARRLGDILVVTVTPDRFVNKGPHRPVFSQDLRAEAIAALECVDFVAVNEWPMAIEAIRLLKPDIFVKGSEFRSGKDKTGAIPLEEEAVRAVGGRIEFTEDLVFSASNLVNRHLAVFPPNVTEFLADFAERWPIGRLTSLFDEAHDLKVLVIGDAIIDDYHYCEAIGKSSKEPTLVVKALSSERFAGGALAVANHVANFCDNVELASFLGDKNSEEDFIRGRMHPRIQAHFQTRHDAPTIVKRRFVESYFFTKLFEVYEINDGPLHVDDDAAMCRFLRERVGEFDLVIAMDFGHGAISDEAVQILSEQARFLAVNTQSNAGNFGYHAISRYPRADYVCVAENEMRLEMRNRRGDLRPLVENVSQRLHCPRVMVTRGKIGALGFEQGRGFVEVPAFAGQVVDRIGAGDAFISVTAPCVACDAPMEVAAFIGNAAGAQAVAMVGHRSSIEYGPFLRYLEHLLK